MQVRHAHHHRIAVAALFLCFIVATMIVTITEFSGNEVADRSTEPEPEGLPGAFASGSCSTPVAVNAPAADFATTVSQHPAGTCFVLAAGTYRFHDVIPKDNMSFIGVATATVILDGNGYENAFHGTTNGVTIAQMTFKNFNASGGTTRQEQGPIRGTSALWASDPGAMATNWVISDVVSYGNYASGIFLGDHWTVRNSIFHSNGVTGIGGDSIVGGLIEANIIYGNGAHQATGALVNGGGMKVAQAGSPANPVVVRNNEFYDNEKIAIWCDIGCDGFHVIDNYIHDHPSRGIMFELSSNLVARGNTILRSNTWTNFLGDFNAGAITMGESRDGLIENNLIDDARAGVTLRQTNRPTSHEAFLNNYPYVNYISSNITVRNNIFRNTGMMGISTGATGVGQITAPETISFTGNSYDNPGAMTFWWNNGQQMTFAQWQAAGRDTTASGSQSSSPTTQTRGPQGGSWLTPTTTAPPATAPPTTAPPSTAAPATAPPTTATPATAAPATAAPTTPSTTSPPNEPGTDLSTALTSTTVLKVAGGVGSTASVLQPWGDVDAGSFSSAMSLQTLQPSAASGTGPKPSSARPLPMNPASVRTDDWTGEQLPSGDVWTVRPKLQSEIATPRPSVPRSLDPRLGQLAFVEPEEVAGGAIPEPDPGQGRGGVLVTAGAGIAALFGLSRVLKRPIGA